jgi:hypothetical protein
MRKFVRTRLALAKICFGLGSIWTAAGVLKLIFGVRVTLPLLPPLDLERVSPDRRYSLAWCSCSSVRGSNERRFTGSSIRLLWLATR